MLENSEIRGGIISPLGAVRADNAITDITARVQDHNTTLEGFASAVERLVGEGPPSDNPTVKQVPVCSGLGGDIGNLENTVEQQQSVLDRIGRQIRRLMKE
jgi:hypothetical protein